MKDVVSTCSGVSFNPDNDNSAGVRLSTLVQRYRKARKCLSSKAALMVLIWAFHILLVHLFVTNLNTYQFLLGMNIQYYRIAKSSFPTVFVFLYPIAGLLADLKFGRYKTIVSSLWMLVAGTPFVLLGSAFLQPQCRAYIGLAIPGGILLGTGLILLVCSFVAFNANVIQFGLDQLRDSPSEDQVIFIRWFIWTYQVANLVFRLTLLVVDYNDNISFNPYYYYTAGSMLITVALILIGSLYFTTRRNQEWFFTNYRIINPYKLVYEVTKFAHLHKIPVNRSAFTYCEDELPTGLDLSKAKYGGPFTTEQVEDVKVFYGILKILFALGPVYLLEFSVLEESVIFKIHIDGWKKVVNWRGALQLIFIDGRLLYLLEVVVLCPLYIVVIRPLISYYVPRTLARMGLGMLVYILVMLASLGMDVMAHEQNRNLMCMFSQNITYYLHPTNTFTTGPPLSVSSFYYVIIIQQTAFFVANIMILTSMYEFIFAQCPCAMKGLIMGLSFAVIGIFKALGSVFILPFIFYWNKTHMPSCGTVYYALNIVIGVVAFLIYTYQAKRYNNRIRDEPCHVQRYVEEYYTKLTEDQEYCIN